MNTQSIRTHTRWLITDDLPTVTRIEADSWPAGRAWGADDFRRVMRRRNTIAMVAEYGTWVVGFMAYELFADRLELVRLTVAEGYRRNGIGAGLLAKLASKLTAHRRTRVLADVPDTDLTAHLFLAACGYRAVRVLPDRGCGTLYRFVYAIPREP